jgi:hypothetical protein
MHVGIFPEVIAGITSDVGKNLLASPMLLGRNWVHVI